MRGGFRIALALLLCSVSIGCTTNGGIVERLTIVNRTRYDLEVRVTDESRDGWIPLGRVHRDDRSEHAQLDDLGDVWIFRFEYAGRVLGGELRVDRTRLARERWTVQVPASVDAHLERAGVDPSPER